MLAAILAAVTFAYPRVESWPVDWEGGWMVPRYAGCWASSRPGMPIVCGIPGRVIAHQRCSDCGIYLWDCGCWLVYQESHKSGGSIAIVWEKPVDAMSGRSTNAAEKP